MAGVTSVARSLRDLVFSPRCVNRYALGALLCENRRATIAVPQGPLCARCARPLLMPGADQQCDLCASGRGPAYLLSLRAQSLRAVTVYDGAIRAAILAAKRRGARRLTEPSREMLAAACKCEELAVDLVTHVPLHTARRRQRGYNQSQLQARETARRPSLSFLPDSANRARATEPQTHLQGDQRSVNVAQAFALANTKVVERIKDRRIRLIDDVTATGGMLDATAAALAEAGIAAVIGLAFSRPNGNAFS
jgi:predicted amidophosphoribosyltransferase